jgi:hypothetical protein
VEHLWGAGHKEHWPFPKEKMILHRETQMRISFKACNLRLDSCEPMLKANDTPMHTR